MKKILMLMPGLLFSFFVKAQQSRNFIYQNQSIPFLAESNRMIKDFNFPGMQVYIFVSDSSSTAEQLYKSDSLRQIPVSSMRDYACFYYLASNVFLQESNINPIIDALVDQIYKQDYVNRNRIHLIWKSNLPNVSCNTLKVLHQSVASVTLNSGDILPPCAVPVESYISAEKTWVKNRFLTTSTIYTVPGRGEMEALQKAEQMSRRLNEVQHWRSTFFFQATAGVHQIGSKYKTDFDQRTLTDFSKHKTIWNITTGYALTEVFSMLFNVGFIYTGKEKSIDNISHNNGQISVNGSGSGGLMMRYGLGARILPFSRKRLSPFLELTAGGVYVIAAGGKGTKTIGGTGNTMAIKTSKESSKYCALSAGASYRLNRIYYLTSSVQYAISPLKEPVGSVDAFTGMAFNTGLGFTIPVKKSK